MKQWAKKQTGFTIVELLIVVVVIAILAAITIVAYNGINERARQSAVQSALSQANKKILAYAVENSDQYPTLLSDAGVTDGDGISYQYTSDNGNPRSYAITASNGPAGSTAYYLSNQQTTPGAGIAPGHNITVWDKSQDSTAPLNMSAGVSIDTSVFRNSTASIRLAAAANSKSLRISPVTGNVGQVIAVSLWMITDSNWNGTASNSKIRFGTTGGAIINACSYQGVKTTWTFVTCTHTISSGNPSVVVSVGNDATIGTIWLDDISVSIQ